MSGIEGARAGDPVRVRDVERILATLDANGRLDGLPFMPEMIVYAGQATTVYKRADKTCDTINMSGTTRRMKNSVHLTGARCDGSAHGGCQAGCLLFFKEEWLEWSDGKQVVHSEGWGSPPATIDTLRTDTRAGTADDGEPVYRCQATQLLRATSGLLSPYTWSQYVGDVRTGNERLHTVAAGLVVLFFNIYQRRSRRWLPQFLRIKNGDEYPFFRGTGPSPAPPPLDLRPGELVEVKTKDEILPTLNQNNCNRGLVFGIDMLHYCGRQARVLRRVERIIDEVTGRMIRLRDCIVLDDVVCYSGYHGFCPRAVYAFWREAWLRRVEEPNRDARRAG